MTDAEILNRLTAIFREIFRDDTIVVGNEMTAADVERWDSLSHVDMMLMVEEEFGLRFQTREVTGMKKVGDLVRLIQAKKA